MQFEIKFADYFQNEQVNHSAGSWSETHPRSHNSPTVQQKDTNIENNKYDSKKYEGSHESHCMSHTSKTGITTEMLKTIDILITNIKNFQATVTNIIKDNANKRREYRIEKKREKI